MATSIARRRVPGRIVLALFALVTLVAPLLHHDFECHLNSRPHCDACTASPTASKIETGVVLSVRQVSVRPGPPESVEAKTGAERPSSPGRAPPAKSCFA